jgi:hypothetical protein
MECLKFIKKIIKNSPVNNIMYAYYMIMECYRNLNKITVKKIFL